MHTPAILLLQATVEIAGTGEPETLSVFQLLLKGGPIMIPILLLSLISVYLFVERLLYINKASKIDPTLIVNVKERLFKDDVDGAISYCERILSPFSTIVLKGLTRIGSPIRDIETAIENTAKVEVFNMEKHVNLLAAIAALAPMFGFLGTVMGMIKAFHNIALSNNVSIGIIASGIYEKMITSASGLIVGVMAYIFFTYLNTRIERTVNKMEITAIEFMDILHKPVK